MTTPLAPAKTALTLIFPAAAKSADGKRLLLLTLTMLLVLPAAAHATPTARFTMSPAAPAEAGSTVTFDASTSTCDRAPCTYRWYHPGEFDAADGTSDPSASFVYRHVDLASETHRVDLNVRNAIGETDTDSLSFKVVADSPAPTPTPSPTPTSSPSPTPSETPTACSLSATTSNFAAQIAAATAGQTVCLASGNYGTWTGTSKAITVRKAAGASPVMKVDFDTGDAGFTLDGMGGMGGDIAGGANDITIKNSAFTSQIVVDVSSSTADILLDHNTHNNIDLPCWPCAAGRITAESGGLTVQNSLLSGGDSDGVQIGGGPGVKILNNEFLNIAERGPNHTDNIQWYGGFGATVKGNWFHNTVPVATQVIAAYDGTSGNVIEDNVVETTSRPWAIELYSDAGSIVRHNTLVYGTCDWSYPCGQIDITRKDADDVGHDTQVYDNVATQINTSNGSTLSRRDHSMLRLDVLSGDFLGTPQFVGGAHPTSYAGYRLAPGSPGKGAASDGLDVGIR